MTQLRTRIDRRARLVCLVGLTGAMALAAPAASRVAHAQQDASFGSRHAELPLVETLGGAVLPKARVVPIFYATDPLAAQLPTFYARLGASDYLERSLREYGIDSVTIAPPVVVAGPFPSSVLDSDVSTWVGAQIDAGVLPPEDGNTLYQIVYPAGTQVNESDIYGDTYPTCTPFSIEAYSSAGQAAPLSIVPLCEGNHGLSDLDAITTAAAAGLADTLTQPYAIDDPAYATVSWNGSGWAWWVGDGVGLLCQATLDDAAFTPASVGYRLPLIWSNRAARRNDNPCPNVLSPTRLYFNAAPEGIAGTMPYPGSATKGIILPAAGGKITIPVKLYSNAPTGDWTLSATERTDLDYQIAPVLFFAFDKAKGRNGDVRSLTITRAAPGDGAPATELAFEIASTLGGVTHEWIVTVGND